VHTALLASLDAILSSVVRTQPFATSRSVIGCSTEPYLLHNSESGFEEPRLLVAAYERTYSRPRRRVTGISVSTSVFACAQPSCQSARVLRICSRVATSVIAKNPGPVTTEVTLGANQVATLVMVIVASARSKTPRPVPGAGCSAAR